uniref:Protein TIFY n=1 Tax=Anthurium amnicola TaxID=1678845 RepID=A0A1D1ZAU7_9ARAE
MSKATVEIDFLGTEADATSTFGPETSSTGGRSPAGAAPLTIFYNGTVTTYILPHDKAEAIIKWAESGVRPMERPAHGYAFHHSRGGRQQWQPQPLLLHKLAGDLPLARKRSLQRFLQKRKER